MHRKSRKRSVATAQPMSASSSKYVHTERIGKLVRCQYDWSASGRADAKQLDGVFESAPSSESRPCVIGIYRRFNPVDRQIRTFSVMIFNIGRENIAVKTLLGKLVKLGIKVAKAMTSNPGGAC